MTECVRLFVLADNWPAAREEVTRVLQKRVIKPVRTWPLKEGWVQGLAVYEYAVYFFDQAEYADFEAGQEE